MEADAGFVQDVEHVDEAAADLRSQADALAFAAGEGGRGAVEGEVVEADFEDEVKARADLFEDLHGDGSLRWRELFLQSVDPLGKLGDVHRGRLGDVLAVDEVMQRFLVQALALTLGADGGADEWCGLFARRGGLVVAFALHHGDVFRHALVGVGEAGVAEPRRRDGHRLFGAVDDFVHRLFGKVLDGRLERCAVSLAEGLYLSEDECVFVFPERRDAPLVNAERGVGDDLLHVDHVHFAEAFAAWAGAVGRVEREVVWRRLTVSQSGHGTHQSAAVVTNLVRCGVEQQDESVSLLHGHAEALLEAWPVVDADHELVDDHLNAVHLVSIQLHAAADLHQLTVDAHVEVALLAHLLEELLVVPLAVADERCEEVHLPSVILPHDQLQNLLLGVLDHLLAAEVGVGLASAGVEQAEEVVDLRSGADGGAWVAVRRLLLDGDDGAQAGDLVHVWPLHVAHEVASVGREGVDVAALTFGEDGVEGERRLAASTHTRDDGEAVAGQLDVDILQVVHACTPYANGATPLDAVVCCCDFFLFIDSHTCCVHFVTQRWS